MALDAVTEADILDWIGHIEDGDQPLEAVYQLRGSVEATALSILKRRRAAMGPESWGLPSDYYENDGGRTRQWLDGQIERLRALCGEEDPTGVAAVGAVTRDQPHR